MSHFKFGKSHRLLSSQQYQLVFDAVSARASTKEVLLLAAQNDVGHPRLGIIVSKKVDKRAVERNRIKRILRERFRHTHEKLPSVDIIALVRPPCKNTDNDYLDSQCRYLFKKLTKNVQKNAETSHN